MNAPIETTLVEMVRAMSKYRDDEPFRWFQCSILNARDEAQATDTLLVTMGQARRELGIK